MNTQINGPEDWASIVANLSVTQMLLDPLVPMKAKTLLHGPPGSGKSAVLWGIGNAISRGESYLGLPSTKANVLLISTDMNLFETHMRWGSNFVPAFHYSFTSSFNCTAKGFSQTHCYRDIQAYIQAKEIQLVLIDTLGGLHSGRSAKDDDVADDVDRVLGEWFPEQAILVVGHDRKMRYDRGVPMPPEDEDFLGSNKWRANFTSQVHIWRCGKHQSQLKHAKTQVSIPLQEKLRLYIDIHGQAELWSDVRASKVIRLFRDALTGLPLGLNHSEQDAIVANTHHVTARTVRRWRSLSEAAES